LKTQRSARSANLLGKFEDARVLKKFGELPVDLTTLF
jgi:hypothetical protein